MLNFLLVPLHTIDVFTRTEYGAITKLLAFAGVLNVVFTFGMETAFFRFATKPDADKKRIFNLAQTIVTFICITVSTLLIIFNGTVADYFDLGSRPEVITWLAFILIIDTIVAIPFARLRLEKKALQFASYKIINVLVLLGLNLYFLKVAYNPAVNIGYVFLATLIANAIYILFFFRTLISWRPAFDGTISFAMIRYSWPIMLTGLAGMVNEMFSRMTLDWWLPENFYGTVTNQEAVGIFGACYKYAVLMNLGVQAFRYAAEPFFFSNASDKNSSALFARVNHFFILTGCLVFIGVSINLDLLKYLIGEPFRSGLNIVPVLLMAYLFLGIYYNISIWFKLADKTYYGTIITIAGVMVTLAGNYLLIPVAGFMGSSWAAFLCYFSMTALCYWLGQKHFPVPYTIVRSMAWLLFSAGLVWVSGLFQPDNQFLATSFHSLILILFIVMVFLVERKNFLQEV